MFAADLRQIRDERGPQKHPLDHGKLDFFCLRLGLSVEKQNCHRWRAPCGFYRRVQAPGGRKKLPPSHRSKTLPSARPANALTVYADAQSLWVSA